MERNQIIGFILIFATLMVWTIMTKPSDEVLAQRKRVQDSIGMAAELEKQGDLKVAEISKEAPTVVTTPEVSDSVKLAMNQNAFGMFAQSASGSEQDFTLENDLIKIVFSSKGGFIKEALLKNYKSVIKLDDNKSEKAPLYLLGSESNKFGYTLAVPSVPSGVIRTENLFFTGVVSRNKLTLTAATPTGASIVQEYTLDEAYNLDYHLILNGMNQVLDGNKNTIELNWQNHLPRLEKNAVFEQRYSTIYYKETSEDDADYCSCMKDDEQDFVNQQLDWVSHSNQFFNTSLIAKGKPFAGGKLTTQMTDLEKTSEIKIINANLEIPFTHGNSEDFAMQLYIGPNEFQRLAAYEVGLQEIIPFGTSIFGTINRWVIRPAFDFLSKYIGSKGIVIIILIFIIKMLLYPLMYKMLHSQAKMAALKPELAHLTEKFKEEPQKKQMETMKIYREFGVSPLGGCMPMLLQMPIWYALFRFFPASIRFRQESFLWADDLSSYDAFFNLGFELPFMGSHLSLFTILWAVTTLIYTYYNTKHMDMSANPAMKYVQYFMPIMFLGFFNTYASGLTCYMFFSNIFNILQTVITKKYVFNDEKILAELQKQKAKPKKKGGFQSRIEEAMKQQQAIKEQRDSKKKK